jgi:hypothetical protein
VNFTDLSGIPEPELDAAFQRELEALRSRPFEYVREPLIRFYCFKCDSSKHILITVTSELVMDLWSFKILFGELEKIYAGLRRGIDVQLPTPPQYADIVLWQRKEYAQRAADSLEYWREFAARCKSLGLDLPMALPRPADFRFVVLSAEADFTTVHRRVRSLCETKGVSPFTFYLTAYVVLLYALSRATRIYLLTPSAQRNHVDLEQVVGRFSRALYVEVEVSDDQTVVELLESVSRSVLVGQEHLHVSPVTLIEMLPRLDPTKPVSYLGFAFDHRHLPILEGVSVEPFSISTSSGPWLDLNLWISSRGNETKATLKYSQQSFRPAAMRDTLSNYAKCVDLLMRPAPATVSEVVEQLMLLPSSS